MYTNQSLPWSNPYHTETVRTVFPDNNKAVVTVVPALSELQAINSSSVSAPAGQAWLASLK